MSTAQTGRTHDLHPTASRKPKNPLTRGCRPHMTHKRHPVLIAAKPAVAFARLETLTTDRP